jgi:hypothetical protein
MTNDGSPGGIYIRPTADPKRTWNSLGKGRKMGDGRSRTTDAAMRLSYDRRRSGGRSTPRGFDMYIPPSVGYEQEARRAFFVEGKTREEAHAAGLKTSQGFFDMASDENLSLKYLNLQPRNVLMDSNLPVPENVPQTPGQPAPGRVVQGPRGVVSAGTGTPRSRYDQARRAHRSTAAATPENTKNQDVREYRSVDGGVYSILLKENNLPVRGVHPTILTHALVEMAKGGEPGTVFHAVGFKLQDAAGELVGEFTRIDLEEIPEPDEDDVPGVSLG